MGTGLDTTDVAAALGWQADHAARNGAPATGRVIAAMLPLLDGATAVGRRMRDWPGLSLEDAMPLRLAGGLHSLHLSGAEARLGPVYAGTVTDQAAVDAIVGAVVADHEAALLPWFDCPPQTNEAGRSAGVMAALLWCARAFGPKFELNEIGASAGINTMMDRFAFDLGGVAAGVPGSPLTIRPEWRGPPPPAGPVEINGIHGSDIAPVDLTDPAQALRLKSYVWAEVTDRLARIDAAVAFARERAPDLVRADAADFVAARLAAPQQHGVTRILFHTIVWQYLPEATRLAIEAAMAAAGTRATAARPLAWIQLETNRATFAHEIRAKVWPGNGGWTLLGSAHAHGAWVEWAGA